MLRSAAAPMKDLRPRPHPRRTHPRATPTQRAALLVLFPFFGGLVALDPHADLVDT